MRDASVYMPPIQSPVPTDGLLRQLVETVSTLQSEMRTIQSNRAASPPPTEVPATNADELTKLQLRWFEAELKHTVKLQCTTESAFINEVSPLLKPRRVAEAVKQFFDRYAKAGKPPHNVQERAKAIFAIIKKSTQ